MWRKSAAALAALAALAAGCGRAGVTAADADRSHGPITVWFSNNAQEWQWGQRMTAAWNRSHPDERVTGQQVPAGKTTEEVISASIIAGTTPCLVYNTSPASVPQFQQQAGLVPLDTFPGARSYIEQRTGARSAQYASSNGHFYQMPWKSNPVMVIYNKKLLAKAGVDPHRPPLATYAQFLDTSRKIVRSKAAQAAIWPAPTSEFFQSWYDFYSLFIAASGGRQLVEDGEPQFDSPAGQGVDDFWRTMYAERLSPQEAYSGDAFSDGQSAMALVGPWAVDAYQKNIDWGVAPVPTPSGTPANRISTFSDEKSIGMYTSCTRRATAWDFLKYTTSPQADGSLLDITGQMPMRADVTAKYPAFFAANPGYKPFADQAERTVEVPDVGGSTDIWQDFRNDYTTSVIFGRQSPSTALHNAARQTVSLMRKY